MPQSQLSVRSVGLSRPSKTADRQAFIAYVNVHILFSSKSENALPAAQACPLVMPSEIQSRLGGAFQAAVERYATDKEINGEEESQDNDGKLIRSLHWPKADNRLLTRESKFRNPIPPACSCFRRCYTMWCPRFGSC
jgi:hypothetical protein